MAIGKEYRWQGAENRNRQKGKPKNGEPKSQIGEWRKEI